MADLLVDDEEGSKPVADGASRPPGTRERLRSGLDLRLQRILTPHLIAPVRWALLAGQVLALLLCVVVATGWRGPTEVDRIVGATYRPWQALLTMVALGTIAVAVSIASSRSRGWRRAALFVAGLVVTLLAVAALPSSGWGRAAAVVGTGCTVLALSLPARGRVLEATRCLLASVPFVAAVVAAVVLGSDVDRALSALRADQLAVSSALALSLLAIFAAATALEEHRERTETLLTWRIGTRAVVLAACAKVVLLLALYRHLTGGFLGGEDYWQHRLDQPLSWLHAVLVAGLVTTVALVSRYRPLEGGRFATRMLVLTMLLGVMHVVALMTVVLATAVGVIGPLADPAPLFGPADWLIDHVVVLQLAGVMVLLAAAIWSLRGRRPLTTGVYLWLVAGVWLGPALAGIEFTDADDPAAWAAPGQVDTVLTLTALVIVLLPAARRVSRRALMVLLVVPVVVLHIGMFWPDGWTRPTLQLVVVAAAAASLWLNPPPVYADRRRNERVRALLVARTVSILVLYLYLFTDPALDDQVSTTTTLAWLWLGVPLAAVLTARVGASGTRRRSQSASSAQGSVTV
ncbi:hypothetical protein [Ornithinimicrobium sp. LYQ103]|uniref:hypothetical protein n=1 Tax=Ornithinimicrobium sp. LYQ103 TaxID=3378796 RepID=UPI0038551E47